MSHNPQCSINKNKDSCRPLCTLNYIPFLSGTYLLMKSRLKPLQATCRPHTDKQVTQFSSRCHTSLHKLCIRRTPPGHSFRLPCPFSPQALCPVIISKLWTVFITHKTQLSEQNLTFFCKQMFYKRNSLNVGIYSLFCVPQSWRNHSM